MDKKLGLSLRKYKKKFTNFTEAKDTTLREKQKCGNVRTIISLHPLKLEIRTYLLCLLQK
jgi:hypothetical protein